MAKSSPTKQSTTNINSSNSGRRVKKVEEEEEEEKPTKKRSTTPTTSIINGKERDRERSSRDKDKEKDKSSSSSKKKSSQEAKPKSNYVAELDDDGDDDSLPYGLSDGEEDAGQRQGGRGRVNGERPEYEEMFYTPAKKRHGRKGRDNGNDAEGDDADLLYKQPVAQAVTLLQYYDQTVNYTREMLDQLSRQIRRHPGIASRSYHFLHKGLGTKILHQKIHVAISATLALMLIALYTFAPLPAAHRFELSPTSPTMQENHSPHIGFDDNFDLPLQQHNHTAFKENWARFTIVGVSNYLCGNYNFNPIMDAMMPPGDELHNVRLFGSALLAGVFLFVVWLLATRLAEREIILDSGIYGQVAHGVLTIIVIPIMSAAFWALMSLYFTQTIVVSSGIPNVTPGKEDVFKCVGKTSSWVQELMTFSPIRELLVGAVGISVRVANAFFKTPVQALALHDRAGLAPEAMAPISLMWCLVVGTSIYYLMTIVSSIYTVFHDNKVLNHQSQFKQQVNDQQLMTIDLKSLPSFLPEVAATQNFVVAIILLTAAFGLWAVGLPSWRVHEGEAFYVVLALVPLIKALYNLKLIEQRKQKVPIPEPHITSIHDEDVDYD